MGKLYNLIYLFDTTGNKILMQMRTKNPYNGLLNGTGGKIEQGESVLHSCYREMNEETGYTPKQHTEFHLASVRYDYGDTIYIHCTKLITDALPATMGEPLDLRWISLNQLHSMPVEKFAPSVQRDLEHCLRVMKPAEQRQAAFSA